MTELLIIKAKDDYYRFKDDSYFPCGLDNGSVFSLDQVEKTKKLCAILLRDGIAEATVMKLTIVEKPYLMAS